MSETIFFASRTLTAHLIRGAIAVALLWAVLEYQQEHAGWALLAGALSLVALRGCPVCWTIGLVETVGQRWRAMRAGHRP